METGAGFGRAGSDPGRTRGLELLAELTEALCELGCLEDAQTRVQFGQLLGEHLGRRVEARGVKLRDDAALFARTSLSVAGGEHVLLLVVRVYEGLTVEAAKVERVLLPEVRAVPDTTPSGPLSRAEEDTARALLNAAESEVPPVPLRDTLVRELDGLDLPMGLSTRQLLYFAVELNVQPDGLPPAVLLMEHAALLTAETSHHRTALGGWVDKWVRENGLSDELQRRRVRRAAAAYDPDVPRCLVVSVEPTRDGSDEIMVRSWLNTTPGRWSPQPGEQETTRLDDLDPAVERTLHQTARLWTAGRHSKSVGQDEVPPYVEFVLPYDLLNHDVAGLRLRIGDGSPLPVALKYAVHLRSLERMRSTDLRIRQQWQARWRDLSERGVVVHGWNESDVKRLDAWETTLAGDSEHTAVVMDAPESAFSMAALKAAIGEGIGLALWDRRGVFLKERREVLTAVFASVPTYTHIPMAIHRLRRDAKSHDESFPLLGWHVALLWDDPNRLVDFHDPDHGLPASEETPT